MLTCDALQVTGSPLAVVHALQQAIFAGNNRQHFHNRIQSLSE